MQIVTFSFGSLLEGVMELNNLSRADIAKKLGISINNTYGTFSLFKQNKGNLNKFIDYANALNKKVFFIFSKIQFFSKFSNSFFRIAFSRINVL